MEDVIPKSAPVKKPWQGEGGSARTASASETKTASVRRYMTLMSTAETGLAGHRPPANLWLSPAIRRPKVADADDRVKD